MIASASPPNLSVSACNHRSIPNATQPENAAPSLVEIFHRSPKKLRWKLSEAIATEPPCALPASPNQRAGARYLFLVYVIRRRHLIQQHALRLDYLSRRHAELGHRCPLEPDLLNTTRLVHGQKRNPVLGHGRSEHIPDACRRFENRRRLDARLVRGLW